ncbi:hypothetical protein ILP92_14595 [Maribius pontilimi]|uniref:Uncharacterized protein n=1 Tax=Palleronia pontilimi TaxID=1964209 RepID=A0A934IJC0_9RHOB|nr:hypothetical protein [Palleronia pontilimi]MBJ3763978.1 hypothetical protein [Palleronia pontilimi]
MRIAIDMDEVIADTHAAKAAMLADMGYSWTEDDLAGRKLTDLARPEDAARIEATLQEGTIFANLDVIDGAQQALETLARDHELFIATAAMEYPASCTHKIAWMQRYFPFVPVLNIVLCGHKSIIHADALIDDSPRHFPGFRGIGICFDALHNRGETVEHRLMRWADAPALIDSLQ